MQIRPFEDGDETALIALWRRCGLVVAWNDPMRDLQRKLDVGRELLLLGIEDGQLMASAMGGYDGHRGCVSYLAVAPEFRGRGHGRALMAAVEARLLSLGCPKINVMVRHSNAQVIAFYEALGYRPDAVVNLGKRLITDS